MKARAGARTGGELLRNQLIVFERRTNYCDDEACCQTVGHRHRVEKQRPLFFTDVAADFVAHTHSCNLHNFCKQRKDAAKNTKHNTKTSQASRPTGSGGGGTQVHSLKTADSAQATHKTNAQIRPLPAKLYAVLRLSSSAVFLRSQICNGRKLSITTTTALNIHVKCTVPTVLAACWICKLKNCVRLF